MGRKSTIQRLPAEVRELIGRLRERGRTIDEILAKLGELEVDVSRSALGRHVQRIDAIAGQLREQRAVAEAIVARLGDAPESRVARLNIELMHNVVMKLVVGEDGTPVSLDAKEAMFVASSLQKLAAASKTDVDRELKIRQETAKKAAAAVEAVAKSEGLSEATVESFRRQILGVAER